MLTLIHAAHILLGTIWMVGTLILACIVYPIIARRPADQAKRSIAKLGAVAAPLIGASGGLTLLIGPLRAFLGGRIADAGDLAQPYAYMTLAAFVLVLAATILHARFRRNLTALTSDSAGFTRQAFSRSLIHAVVQVVLMVAILGLMGAMGSGRF
ncbi:MAG: hypothetical protein H7317_17085 [Pseudorhodobacter sp.]|nr:hypothetical protein [Pseudorhodobacter sp.]